MTHLPLSEGTPMPVPTCAQHPQRETYLRCARCERSICPDCMVSAPVGFQCHACVDQAAKQRPQVRTSLGARPGTRPILTYMLIAVMVVLHGITSSVHSLYYAWQLHGRMMAEWDQWYRVLTAPLLHVSMSHLAFNMLALWMFGSIIETSLGHRRFALLYLLAALGGSTASYLFSPANTGSVGASGAIFGLLGACLIIYRRVSESTTGLWVVLVINVAYGFFVPNIDWRAHLGGLLAGVLVAVILTMPAQRRSTQQGPSGQPQARRRLLAWWQWVALLAVVGVMASLMVVRTAQLRDRIDRGLSVAYQQLP